MFKYLRSLQEKRQARLEEEAAAIERAKSPSELPPKEAFA